MSETSLEETTSLIPAYGIPAAVRDNRRPYQKKLAIYLILASVLCERVAFYALVANLAVTLESTDLLGWSSRHSLAASFIFSGTSYIATVIFAVISDAKLGRSKTIVIGFFLYLLGYSLVTTIAKGDTPMCYYNGTNHTSTVSIIHEKCDIAVLASLICTAIGAGAVKSNMAVFGAEQIQKSKIKSRYFDKYIVSVNIGSIIATVAIPYIQKDASLYFTGYIFAGSILLVGALLFIIGYRCYIHIKPYDTVIAKCIPVVKNAFQTWLKYKKARRSLGKQSKSLSNSLHNLTNEDESMRIDEQSLTFLDFAKAANGGKFLDRIVDDVKSLRKALVVFFLLIPYWLIYHQLHTTFSEQGQQMKLPYDTMPVTWMSLGDPVTIIIGVLILNIFVYKYLDARNRAVTIIDKFVIGLFSALITMCIAGIVEVFRQQHCDDSKDDSNLSIYTQLPQNVLMGFAELFATVASYEFAYFTAPSSAQSLFMSLHFCSAGISSFIGTAYIYGFPKTDVELNFSCRSVYAEWRWSFYTYFFILAALQLLFVIILIVCHKKFQIVKVNPQKTVEN